MVRCPLQSPLRISIYFSKEQTQICFDLRNMSYENTSCTIFLKLLLLLILYPADVVVSSPCLNQCGGVKILYLFGVGKSCYLEKSYEIKCRNTSSSGKQVPFLSVNSQYVEVVNISLPAGYTYSTPGFISLAHSLNFGLVRVKFPMQDVSAAIRKSLQKQ